MAFFNDARTFIVILSGNYGFDIERKRTHLGCVPYILRHHVR